MGLFKAFKKIGKSLFKGLKKVFSIPGKILGKVIGKKWAKRLMMAAAVFTGGMALLSGVGGFLGGSGFFGRFVSGGQAFVKGLFNPIGAAKGAVAGAQAGTGVAGTISGAATGAASGAGFAPTAAVSGGAQAGAGAAAATPGVPGAGGYTQAGMNAMAPPGMAPGAAAGAGTAAQNLATASGGGGLLSKAGNFLKTPGGGMVALGALQGYASGKAAEAERKRIDENLASRSDPEQVAAYQDAVNQDLSGLPKFRAEMDKRMERIKNRSSNLSYDNPYQVATA